MDTLFADQHVELLPSRTTLKRGGGGGGGRVTFNIVVIAGNTFTQSDSNIGNINFNIFQTGGRGR
jgi:hypothetical protein